MDNREELRQLNNFKKLIALKKIFESNTSFLDKAYEIYKIFKNFKSYQTAYNFVYKNKDNKKWLKKYNNYIYLIPNITEFAIKIKYLEDNGYFRLVQIIKRHNINYSLKNNALYFIRLYVENDISIEEINKLLNLNDYKFDDCVNLLEELLKYNLLNEKEMNLLSKYYITARKRNLKNNLEAFTQIMDIISSNYYSDNEKLLLILEIIPFKNLNNVNKTFVEFDDINTSNDFYKLNFYCKVEYFLNLYMPEYKTLILKYLTKNNIHSLKIYKASSFSNRYRVPVTITSENGNSIIITEDVAKSITNYMNLNNLPMCRNVFELLLNMYCNNELNFEEKEKQLKK